MKKWLHGILNFIQVNVGFGFDVKAKEALNYFKSKGLKESFSYVDVFREEHASAFTVAKMMDMDLLKDVQDSLHAALAEGLSFDSWKERIVPSLQSNGWWGRQAVYDPISGKTIVSELGSPHRLEVIFRTNMQMAYSVGQWQQIMAQSEEAPYLMYDAVDDYRTRPQHWAWNKTILRFDNPWWRTHYPPNGWLCFLPEVEVDGALNGGVRRFYNGKAIEIFTASGRSLKVTANHPILTRRGWVAAEMISPTDQLLAYDRPVKAIDLDGSPGQMYDQKFIPSAENLFKAMVRDAFALTESPAFQFDSNFLPVNGEVHINVVNGGLLVQSKPDTGAGVEKTLFVRGSDSSLSALHIPVSTAQGDFVAPNIVGTQDSVNVPLGAFEFDRQGSLTDFAGGVPLDNDSLTLVIVFSCGFPSSGTLPYNRFRVLFDDLPLSRFSLGLRTEDNTLFSELSSNGTSVDSGLFSYLVDTYAAQVFADPVINIRKFSFSGHVYDFQSEESILSANGIITHNCRCGVIQLSDGDLEVMGLSVSDTPRITYSNWQNPRTGINQKIPEGIDPGFNYNPGMLRYDELQKVAKEKAAALPDNLRAAAEQSLKNTTKEAKKPVDFDVVDGIPVAEQRRIVNDWIPEYERRTYPAILGDSEIASAAKGYGLSIEEQMALRYYTDTGHGVNSYLLETTPYNKKQYDIEQDGADLLNQALSKLPNHEGVVVSRMTLPDSFLKKMQEGSELLFPAFTSADDEADVFPSRKHRLIIKSKTGKKIRWISEHADNESEVLFGSPTWFKVTGVEQKEDGEIWFHMSEVDE